VKFDLIRPCEHCPFRTDEGRISFAGRERAEEIEEIAYRQGFVCHQHAECVEHTDEFGDEGEHYDFRDDGTSQHCFGALYMYIRDGGANVPWEHATEEDEGLADRWWQRVDLDAAAVVFEDEEAFLTANEVTR